jgi:5-methylcytosine-specific restriction protein A
MAKDKDYIKMINSVRWKRLRVNTLNAHPFCQRCLEDNKYVPACEVHHITPVESVVGLRSKEELMFNPSNLRALCHDCHIKTHMELGRGTKANMIERTKKEVARAKKFFE